MHLLIIIEFHELNIALSQYILFMSVLTFYIDQKQKYRNN